MERVTTALSAIKETGESGANSIGGFLSSSTETGVSAFKGTSLGESFFKKIGNYGCRVNTFGRNHLCRFS
jgi:hypothetical protein